MAAKVEILPLAADSALTQKVTDNLEESLRPLGEIERKRSSATTQAVGEVLLIAVTHVTVTGILEAVRLAWDLYNQPIRVKLKDHSELVFKGQPKQLHELKDLLNALVSGAENDGTNTA